MALVAVITFYGVFTAFELFARWSGAIVSRWCCSQVEWFRYVSRWSGVVVSSVFQFEFSCVMMT